jgi:protein ImuB
MESLDAVHLAVRELTRQIAAQLTTRGLGAREFRLTFRQPYAPAIEKTVRLMRPSRNEPAMLKLICCAIENLEIVEGFVAVTMAVKSSEPLGDEQAALIGGERERDAAELDHLVERLRARLDRGGSERGRSVEWGELVESNLPELVWRSRDAATKNNTSSGKHAVDLLRPLRLLRQPRCIRVMVRPSESLDGAPISFTDRGDVHRLTHIRPPERITGQWWNGRWKIRDYFDVLDAQGDRYWIFRVVQTGRWFLHGIFE